MVRLLAGRNSLSDFSPHEAIQLLFKDLIWNVFTKMCVNTQELYTQGVWFILQLKSWWQFKAI